MVVDNKGMIQAVYRKIHLFDVSLGKDNEMSESTFVSKGMAITPPVSTPIGKLGLSIVLVMGMRIVLRHSLP